MRTETTLKQIELLRDLLPSARRIAWLSDITDPAYLAVKDRVFETAARLGFDLSEADGGWYAIGGGTPLLQVAAARAEALLSWARYELLGFKSAAESIIGFGIEHRVATVFAERDSVERGGLIFYGVDPWSEIDRAADQLARILTGAKPADTPVDRAIRFELVLNLKTAKAIGIKVPAVILARADQVIE